MAPQIPSPRLQGEGGGSRVTGQTLAKPAATVRCAQGSFFPYPRAGMFTAFWLAGRSSQRFT
jgi:hypothetical protein